MGYPRRFSMHQFLRAYHFASVCLRDRLMSKAYTENRGGRTELPDDGNADTCSRRRPRTRRDNDRRRIHVLYRLDVHLIISPDHDVTSELAQVLDQIVCERIVVVDYQNHARG